MMPWEDLVSPEELATMRAAQLVVPRPAGTAMALVVVDATYDFVGDEGDDLPTAIGKFRLACGPAAWVAMRRMVELLGTVRALGVPVFYTRPIHSPSGSTRGQTFPAIVDPLPHERVIAKPKASAFFGTSLVDELRGLGVDHVVVVGGTTSGCVRATVVDGWAYDLGVTIIADCVFDRFPTSHKIGLFDMACRYAEVIALVDFLERLRVDRQPASRRRPAEAVTPSNSDRGRTEAIIELDRLVLDAYNRLDLESLDRTHSDDVTMSFPGSGIIRGRDAVKNQWQKDFVAFPDARFSLVAQAASGNTAFSEWTWEGTNTGNLPLLSGGSLPPTGKRATSRGVSVSTFEAGQLKEQRFYYDRAEFLRQLGIT